MALPTSFELNCRGFKLAMSHPHVMGVLNVTPDSFSDGGSFQGAAEAVERGHEMAEQGASLIDIGGESTRPGAQAVGVDEELARVVPVVEALSSHIDVPISVDTSKSEVMQAALEAGACLINDVTAMRQDPKALDILAGYDDVPVCLMHMQGQPSDMQQAPHYDDVVGEVMSFLAERMAACESAGIAHERLVIDPGFGFGKSDQHNLTLLRCLERFERLGAPILVGLSRKSTLGRLLDKPVHQRLWGSLAAACWAVSQGANLIRAHDVAETVEAVHVVQRIQSMAAS